MPRAPTSQAPVRQTLASPVPARQVPARSRAADGAADGIAPNQPRPTAHRAPRPANRVQSPPRPRRAGARRHRDAAVSHAVTVVTTDRTGMPIAGAATSIDRVATPIGRRASPRVPVATRRSHPASRVAVTNPGRASIRTHAAATSVAQDAVGVTRAASGPHAVSNAAATRAPATRAASGPHAVSNAAATRAAATRAAAARAAASNAAGAVARGGPAAVKRRNLAVPSRMRSRSATPS